MATVKEFYDFVENSEFAEKFSKLKGNPDYYNSREYITENFSDDNPIRFNILNTIVYNYERASLELEVVTESNGILNNLTLLYLSTSISEDFVTAWLNR